MQWLAEICVHRPVFATVRRSAPAEFVEEAAALAPEVAVRVLGLGETLAL